MLNMLRRTLSMIVCAAMLISCIPAMAEQDEPVQILQIAQDALEFAEEAEQEEAFEEVSEEVPADLAEIIFTEDEPAQEEAEQEEPAEEEPAEEEILMEDAMLLLTLTGEDQPKTVTEIVAAQSTITLGVKEQISVADWTVLPEGAVLEGVSYSSKDKSIAAVDETGMVTAKKTGTTTISIKAEGVATEKIKVVVKKAPKKVVFDNLPAVLGVGEKLAPVCKLTSGSAGKITLVSDNDAIVAVENGELVAKAVGKANITASTYVEGVTATAEVEVKKAPSKLELSVKEEILTEKIVGKGEKFILQPVMASDESSFITFESSDPKVVSVDAKGNVKAVAAGEASITAKTYLENVYAQCKVTVKAAPTSVSVSAPRKSIGVGEKLQLTTGLKPVEAVSTLTFSSSKKSVATVDANGVVTGVKKGEATITVKTHNGKKKTIKITVKAAPKTVEILADRTVLGVGEALELDSKLSKSSASLVTFSTSDANIAEIVEGNKLMPKAVGKVTVTASTYLPEVKTTLEFEIKKAPTKITLNMEKDVIGKSNKHTLVATLADDEAGLIKFKAENPKIVSVNAETGTFKGLKTGVTKVIAYTDINDVVAECEVEVVSAPTSVSVTAERKTIGVGEKMQLVTSLKPATAQTTLTFSSSKKSVATVDASGEVTALKKGEATITVKTHNGKKKTIKITVKKAPAEVTIVADRTVLGVGEKLALNHKFDSGKAGAVTYTSSNPAIADVEKVDGQWYIVPKAGGKVTLTATTHNSTAEAPVQDTENFEILKAPSKVLLPEYARTMGKGDSWTLNAYLANDEAGKITFESENKKIATVDKNTGKIKAVKGGTVKIFAKSYQGETAECVITVVSAPTSVSVTAEKKKIAAGESLQLITAIKPATAATTLKFSSSKASVATVDQNGLVIGVKEGKATITVKTHNGKKKTFAITVTKSTLSFTTADNADGSVTVTGLVAPYSGVITVPATLNGKPVTAIGANAFSGNTTMTGIVLPDGVKTIGAGAFENCSVLTSADLGTGVQEIGSGAFKNCAVLTGVNLGETSVKTIGASAFDGCAVLTGVELPAGLTSIGDRAFADCDALTKIAVPESVKTLGTGAFAGSEKVSLLVTPGSPAEDYAKENGVKYEDVTAVQPVVNKITVTGWAYETGETASWSVEASGGKGGYKYQYQIYKNGAAYKDASAWTSEATYSFKFTEVGSYTLRVRVKDSAGTESAVLASDAMNISGASASSGLTYTDLSATAVMITGITEATAEVVIPEILDDKFVVAIADNAFKGRTGITKVTLPDSITEIGASAFEDCEKLASINIPASLSTLGANAFNGCGLLTAATLPEGLKSIGEGAFIETGLTAISVPDSVTALGDSVFANCAALATAKLPAGLTTIPDSTFKGCAKLAAITIPAGVTAIKASAFSGCASLAGVVIPASVKTIGEGAFSGCSALKTLTLNEGLVEIAADAFYNNSALTAVKLPSTLTHVRGKAFYGCSALKSVELSAKLTSIPAWTFYGCSALTAITIPAGVTTIADYAFSDCAALATVTIASGSKLTAIGQGAFYSCAALTGIALPDAVNSIGVKAFEGCAKLTGVTLPSKLTVLNDYVFSGCASLTSLKMPAGLTRIGVAALANCAGLTEVTLNQGLTEIDYHAFYNCTGIKLLSIPGSVTVFGDDVFEGTSADLMLGVVAGSEAYKYAEKNGLRTHIEEGTLQYQSLIYSLNSAGSVIVNDYIGSEKNVVIPATIGDYAVTEIGEGAFAGNATMTSIDLPDSVTVIGARAFANCTSLVSMI